MIGDVKLHHVAPQRGQGIRLGADFHAGFHGRRAGGRVALATFNLNEAQAAGAERLQAVGGAQFGDIDTRFARGAQDARAGFNGCRKAINFYLDGFFSSTRRCSEVRLTCLVHNLLPIFPGPTRSHPRSA